MNFTVCRNMIPFHAASLSRYFILGAIISAFWANHASATLTVDLRATNVSGAGTISNGGKTVSGLVVGSTVTFTAYAQLVQATGTTGLGIVEATVNALVKGGTGSSALGSVQGNFLATSGTLGATLAAGVFDKAGSSSAGFVQDLNADTFKDIGIPSSQTVAGRIVPYYISGPGAFYNVGTPIGTNGIEIPLFTIQYQVASLNGSAGVDTLVNLTMGRGDGTAFTAVSAAIWQENGVTISNYRGLSTDTRAGIGSAVKLNPGPPTWITAGGGSWSLAANWYPSIPNATGSKAIFGSSLLSPATVTLDGNKTVGTVAFSNTNSYTIAAGTGGTLYLDNSGSSAQINDTLGSHTISAPISLTSSVDVTVTNAGDTLTVSGPVGGVGGVSKLGSGTLVLGSNNSYAGNTNIGGGTLVVNASGSLGNGTLSFVAGGPNPTLKAGTNALSIGNSVTIANGVAATIDTGGNTLTLTTGTVGGQGALVKTGSGTLVLAADESYSGGTTISLGTLQLGSGGAAGSVAGNIVNNSALVLFSSGNHNLASISGTGSLTQAGSGTTTLTTTTTFSGDTVISGGVLKVGTSLALQNSTLNYDNQGGTLSFDGQTQVSLGGLKGTQGLALTNTASQSVALTVGNSNQNSTYAGVLSDGSASCGSLTKIGSATFALSASNSYTGTTSVNGGVLQVNVDGALGASGSGITVANGASLKLNNVNYSTPESLILNGTGNSGAGALTNTGTSAFAGAVNVASNATVSAGGSGNLLTLTGGITKNGTTLTIGAGGTVIVSGIGISGALSHSDLIVDNSTLQLSASSSYNGATTVRNSGVLKLGGSDVLPNSAATALAVNSSGKFDLAGFNATVASLAGDSTGIVTNSTASSASTLTVNGSIDTTLAGLVQDGSGTVGLVKQGGGKLTLTGTSSYSGGTVIQAGTLNISGDRNLGSVPASPAINLGFDPGAGNSAALQAGAGFALNANRNVLLNSGTAVFDTQSNAATINGAVIGSGALLKSGVGTLILAGSNSYAATIISSGTLQVGNGGTTGTLGTDSLVTDNGTLAFTARTSLPLTRRLTGAVP